MVYNYIKIAWRNLLRYKIYSLINISGLAVGLAVFFLILLYVKDETSYDRHFSKASQIYRLYLEFETTNGTQTTAQSPPGWARYFKTEFPEVEEVTRLKPPQQSWKVQYDEKIFYETGWTFADSSAIEMFDFEILEGRPNYLNQPYQVLLSENIAKKYFSGEDPIGKTFELDNQYHFEVTGVFKKLPHNTHFDFDFLASFVTLRDSIYGTNLLEADNFPAVYTYVQLNAEANPREFEEKLPLLAERSFGNREQLAERGLTLNTHVQPLTEIHLKSNHENEIQPNGQMSTVYLFTAIALFILFIAAVNFVNLSTARSLRRAKEVGLRKTVGASKNQLVAQFIGEAILLSLLAFFFAFFLIALFMPVFSSLVAKPLGLLEIVQPGNSLLFILITLGIGLLSGLYPAIVISSFKPTDVLKSNLGSVKSGKAMLRKVLIVFQFSISILLVICTGIMFRQMTYIKNFDVGLKQDQVLVVQLTDPILRDRYQAFKGQLRQIPNIEYVSASMSAPAGLLNQTAFRTTHSAPDESWLSYLLGTDFNFISAMGIELVAGRDLLEENQADRQRNVLINETAVRSFGWESPEAAIGEEIVFSAAGPGVPPLTIIGVVKDFHLQSVHESISPTVMMYFPDQAMFFCFIHIENDIAGTLNSVENTWKDVMPNYPFQYSFLDDNFDSLYKSEKILKELLVYFAVLAIFIACLGLYGLASYMIELRIKEIGIRKALGSTVSQLVRLLTGEYLILVFIAFLLSAPIAYYLMAKWLETFKYRTDISLITFGVALVFTILISLLTVSYQSIKTSLNNPVRALRSE